MTANQSEFLSILQLLWAFVWASKHVAIRRNRQYATNRTVADTNRRYKILSLASYVFTNGICIASFWSNADFLLIYDAGFGIRIVGMGVLWLATGFYFYALRYLGNQYSPCYDSHVPFALVDRGPYCYIRHPMYLAKILVGVAIQMIGSSWLLLPMLLWLVWEVIVTIRKEEKYLIDSIQAYGDYKRQTKYLVPFLF